jgi:hypothetical protein
MSVEAALTMRENHPPLAAADSRQSYHPGTSCTPQTPFRVMRWNGRA